LPLLATSMSLIKLSSIQHSRWLLRLAVHTLTKLVQSCGCTHRLAPCIVMLPRCGIEFSIMWMWCRKTAVEVAEGLYKQARKRRRAGDTIIPLLEVANADLAYLQ